MRDVLWNSLITSLRSGQCVLVLGPDIHALPVPGDDGTTPISLRDAFCQYLAQQLEDEGQKVPEQVLFAVAQQFDDSSAFETVNLKNIAADFFQATGYQPGPLHTKLAACPFATVLTTCHDDLFERALSANKKPAAQYWYHYRGEPRENRELSATPEPSAPAIYHLFGSCAEPNSLVLTETDLLDFTIHVISGRPKLPDSLRSALRNKTLLFVGFGIRHWYIRVLLKLLVRWLELTTGSVALESLGALDPREREQTVLFYRRGTRIEVVDMEAAQFVDELLTRLDKAGGYQGATKATLKRPQVFISYERSDDAVARRLYQTLPQDTLEPFLDTQFLQGGDDWNEELEQRIKSSDYFLVLNSTNLREKQVGYVNKEVSLALDLQRYRQQHVKFLIPLQVNGLKAEDGRADLATFQQLPLRPETFDADVSEITKLIKRDFQVRQR